VHELRKDPIISRWVAVLEDSIGPESYKSAAIPDSGTSECVLCPGRESETPPETAVVPGSDGKGWSARSVRSLSPVLQPEGELGRKGVGLYDKMNSIGLNEIVIESPHHDVAPEDTGAHQVRKVIDLVRDRLVEIARDERIRYVLLCKNSGMTTGSASPHPHSQILATPVIPLRIKAEFDGAKNYYSYKERCIFCDIVDEEQRVGSRVVLETEHFLAFCPFASKFPFESWILPKRHMCEFQSISPEEVHDLGLAMTALLKKLRSLLNEPPYSYVLHTAPQNIPRRNHWHTLGDDYHWHIEMVPRLPRVMGFEWGSGFYVLTTSPEDAARYLRDA
jgi:UDPglucose--hexose-1-phosphate uridylyltransferase